MSRYKLAVQGLEGSQAISGLLHQCIANELFRTYLGDTTEDIEHATESRVTSPGDVSWCEPFSF
jgi:hypothetical protein